MSDNKEIFYGDINCQYKSCKNGAYFLVHKSSYLCGVHSKKFKNRIELKKRTKKESAQYEKECQIKVKKEIEDARLKNVQANKKGHVCVSRLLMMKKPLEIKGYLKVFPNYKHQNRKDGYGCSSLSPMSLGPIQLFNNITCKNIENFHQGSKCFREEIDKKTGEPSDVFFKNQKKFFDDPVPHRHKAKGVPQYFVWRDELGKTHKLDYVNSRQFYCNFYERLASQTDDFKKLKQLISDGTNIQICGYDGIDVKAENIEKEYLDKTKPFGHELCLFHMLTEDDPDKYIWKKYKKFNF